MTPGLHILLLVLIALVIVFLFRRKKQMRLDLIALNEALKTSNKSLEDARLNLSVQLRQLEAGEKALRQSEQQFRILAEQASLGIAVIQHGKVKFANNGLSGICGYTVDEIMNWEPGGFARVIAPEDLPTIIEHNKMMESGEVTEIKQSTVSVITKGGLRKSLQFFARTIEWYNSNANLLTFIDISVLLEEECFEYGEKEKLETILHGRTAELERANRELESFAYSVSHDLRAPLRSVTGFARALNNDFGKLLPQEGQNYLFRLRDAADYMDKLIDAFLRLSRVTRGELRRTNVDLGLLAQGVIANLVRETPDRKTNVSIASDMVEAVDPTLMQLVLENLLGNAWKYTREKSEALISFTKTIKSGEKVYCVSDNGAGFDMHYSSKLFMPFQRLHKQSEFEGVGIGLAITQKIIFRHGGRIWAQAEVGRGTSIFFTLK
jgi:PAS domain S-box-containing protein